MFSLKRVLILLTGLLCLVTPNFGVADAGDFDFGYAVGIYQALELLHEDPMEPLHEDEDFFEVLFEDRYNRAVALAQRISAVAETRVQHRYIKRALQEIAEDLKLRAIDSDSTYSHSYNELLIHYELMKASKQDYIEDLFNTASDGISFSASGVLYYKLAPHHLEGFLMAISTAMGASVSSPDSQQWSRKQQFYHLNSLLLYSQHLSQRIREISHHAKYLRELSPQVEAKLQQVGKNLRAINSSEAFRFAIRWSPEIRSHNDLKRVLNRNPQWEKQFVEAYDQVKTALLRAQSEVDSLKREWNQSLKSCVELLGKI